MPDFNPGSDLNAIVSGGKAAVAKALSDIERAPFADASVALLDEAYQTQKGTVIGITGPPGAGKSTLINALISHWRQHDESVAVLAVDPSSKLTRGALLGDRVRMRTNPEDQHVIVRSVAARGRLGGLSDTAYPASVLLRAIYDKVIVETVGVGQSETDINLVSDTLILCIQPGSGDSLQFMKAGIVEIPDIAAVTKSDMGVVASRALADIKGALSLSHRVHSDYETQCLALSSLSNLGLETLFEAITHHQSWLSDNDRIHANRKTQALAWIESEIVSQYGIKGMESVPKTVLQILDFHPFHLASQILGRINVDFQR